MATLTPATALEVADVTPSQSPAPIVNELDFLTDTDPVDDSQANNEQHLDIPSQVDKEESQEDSINEMVLNILNDSDNDIVLNNLNGLGYNNIQYNTQSSNENTASSMVYRHAQINNPSLSTAPANKAETNAKPSLGIDIASKNQASKSLEASVSTPKRKYVIEWRTVIFIRHGKSKWNAAEASTLNKAAAAAQGFWEYYKHKKSRQNHVKKQKSDVDIMDAPLSREGILEALNLCTHLREYNQSKELQTYNDLFEQTRQEINEVVALLATTDAEEQRSEITAKLQQLLKKLDEYKIQSLLSKQPPQDDDNLRLPQPVPENARRVAHVNPNTLGPAKFPLSSIPDIENDEEGTPDAELANTPDHGKQNGDHHKDEQEANKNDNDNDKDKDKDKERNRDTNTDADITGNDSKENLKGSRSPSFGTANNVPYTPTMMEAAASAELNGHGGAKRKASASNDSDIVPMENGLVSNPASPTMSYQSLQEFFPSATGNENGSKSQQQRRYMAQIPDPQSAMSAKYVIDMLNGTEAKCGMVVSNLRRAMSTACICLRDRLERKPYEKIHILGCLQEIGLNSDTRPLLFHKDNKPILSRSEKQSGLLGAVRMQELYEERLSMKYYKGDASDKSAAQRLQEFALWLFAQRKYLHVVAIGHSHWFQSFFKAYLPEKIAEDDLPAKVRAAKIRNCGVVAFRIQKRYVPSKSKRHGRHISFEIAPHSITTLKFGLENEPISNHDEREQKEHAASLQKDGFLDFDRESDDDKEPQSETLHNGSVAEHGDDNNHHHEKEKEVESEPSLSGNKPRALSLAQSNSTNTETPDAQSQSSDPNRRPIPNKQPPPVPNEPPNQSFPSIFDQVNQSDTKESKKGKDAAAKKKGTNFGASLKNPKGLWSGFRQKISGSPKPPDSEVKATQNDGNNTQQKAAPQQPAPQQSAPQQSAPQQPTPADPQQQQKELDWDLANTLNNIQLSDDEDYVQ